MFAIKINPETDIESSCLTSTGYNWYVFCWFRQLCVLRLQHKGNRGMRADFTFFVCLTRTWGLVVRPLLANC